MIGSTILGTGINSMLGVDSRYGTDSGLGIDSIFESIPCDSDSGSCCPDPIPILIPEKNGIITPLLDVFDRAGLTASVFRKVRYCVIQNSFLLARRHPLRLPWHDGDGGGRGGGRDRRGGDGRSPIEIHSLRNIKRLREIVRNIA